MWDIVTQDATFMSTLSLHATQTPKFDHSDISLDFYSTATNFTKFYAFGYLQQVFLLYLQYCTVLSLADKPNKYRPSGTCGKKCAQTLQVIGKLEGYRRPFVTRRGKACNHSLVGRAPARDQLERAYI